jgi:transcription elongation factor GreA
MRLPNRPKEEMKRALRTEDHFLTKEKIEKMRREIERLEQVERPQALIDQRTAQEMGDLSENFGYQEAKARVRRIDSRVLTLKERIKSAIVIEEGPDASGKIRIGATVTLTSGGRDVTYQILGSHESNPFRGFISHLSPLGSALIGKTIGESVTIDSPSGPKTYEVKAIT